jgi:serine-type D-Ala-D-Ala carboxypeptidase (penicillin-binding protein 5/6)
MRAVARLLRAIVLVLLVVILLGAGGTGAVLATARLQSATPALTPEVTSTSGWASGPTTSVPIAAPDGGSLALAAVFDNTVTPLASSNAQIVRPIASVAKTMTALAILDVHPLLPGQAGPSLTISQQDVDDYHSIAASGGSFAPVTLGERFSEHDLLIGLMLPSANNLALTAARWVDGSVSAFVHRLNTRAVGLGMLHTHFADPDGLDSTTTSTAADLVLLGEKVVNDDALLSVVSTTKATLPDGTAVQNLNILLGQDPGWVGVKTGWTPDAGGCLLFAARRTLAAGAPPVAMVGAVLGQPPDGNVDLAHPELGGAFDVARASVDNAYMDFTTVRVGPGSIPVTGHVFGPWGAYSALRLTGPDRYVLLHTGDSLSVATTTTSVATPAPAGTRAGSVTVTLKGAQVGTWTLTTAGRLAGPSPWWRLLSG